MKCELTLALRVLQAIKSRALIARREQSAAPGTASGAAAAAKFCPELQSPRDAPAALSAAERCCHRRGLLRGLSLAPSASLQVATPLLTLDPAAGIAA